jgi:hypothetical protein
MACRIPAITSPEMGRPSVLTESIPASMSFSGLLPEPHADKITSKSPMIRILIDLKLYVYKVKNSAFPTKKSSTCLIPFLVV